MFFFHKFFRHAVGLHICTAYWTDYLISLNLVIFMFSSVLLILYYRAQLMSVV